jgi:2-methylisocitrate lyase-like PEP mutase family enzyme
LRQTASAGVVDEVIERLRAFAAAGAEAAYLQILDLDDLDHIRLIASAIASEVASS